MLEKSKIKAEANFGQVSGSPKAGSGGGGEPEPEPLNQHGPGEENLARGAKADLNTKMQQADLQPGWS